MSIVVPVFNESQNITELIQQISLDVPHELLFVDDGSTDDTWAVLTGLAKGNANVRALRFTRNFGKESAIRAGLREARGQAVIVMDGDLQHPVQSIPEFVAKWHAGASVVNGVSTKSRENIQGVLTKTYLSLLRSITGMDMHCATDFKLLDRKVVDAINHLPEKTLFFRGAVHWLTENSTVTPAVTVEIPINPRAHGKSGWSAWSLVIYALDILTSTSTKPLRFVSLASLVLLSFGCALSLQSLYNWASGRAVEGFTTVIVCILMVGSVISLSLGIIGEYLSRIFTELRGRPDYYVAERL